MRNDETGGEIAGAIDQIPAKFGYAKVPATLALGRLVRSGFLQAQFACHDAADSVNEAPGEAAAIVTGFGPTNAPTAGTLSVILKALRLQRETGIRTTIVISDLGAWNSRNLSWPSVAGTTARYLRFLRLLGFDERQGTLRTHADGEHLRRSAILARFLRDSDFSSFHEETDLLYDRLHLRGFDFGIRIDTLLTVADILAPFFDGSRRVIVLAGIEEHYFVRLARIVLDRLVASSARELVPDDVAIGALYGRLIPGLPPYPKMSKSIAASAIGIGETDADIAAKIMTEDPSHQPILLTMMELVSDWTSEQLAEAARAFSARAREPVAWTQTKDQYLAFFLRLAAMWRQCS
jgi:tryptophanyl-tRNA synthetase